MARKKKEVYHVKPLTEGKKNIISALIDEYDIETAEDIQDALRDLLGGTIKSMMEAEMSEHLGYEKSERFDSDNYRNGTKSKKVRSKYGEVEVDVPKDRNGTFEPQVVKKRQKDISSIDDIIIGMYARGLTTRQISDQVEDIYGFECSESFISRRIKSLRRLRIGNPVRWIASTQLFSSMPCISQYGIMELFESLQPM